MALRGINDVDGRFIFRANQFWWAHRIAQAYNTTAKEVKTWDAEEIMEHLAAIGIMEKQSKSPT